jgi:hypothetical protein
MTKMEQFWAYFTAAVVEFDGSDGQLRNASNAQLRKAARAAALSLAVGQEPPVPSVAMFSLTATIYYNLTLEEHVDNGRASYYAHQYLTTEHFPRPTGLNGVVTEKYVVLGPYGCHVSSDQMLAEATRLGLHRPTPEETLVVGRAHRDLMLVGLVEQPWLDPCGNRVVPVVVGGEADFDLLDNGWGGVCSFLFRK